MLMTWHTRFSFPRSATDLQSDLLLAQIQDASTLVDLVLEGGRPTEPAYYMWHKHLEALLVMGMLMSMEWTFNRGFEDKTFWKFSRLADTMRSEGRFRYAPPPWFRDEDVVLSHRSALAQRYPEAYGEMWPSAPVNCPILWPVVDSSDPAVAKIRISKADLALVRQGALSVPSAAQPRIVNL